MQGLQEQTQMIESALLQGGDQQDNFDDDSGGSSVLQFERTFGKAMGL